MKRTKHYRSVARREKSLFLEKTISSFYKLSLGDPKIKIAQFQYVGSVLTEYGMSNQEIRSFVGITKHALEKLCKKRKNFLGLKRVLNSYIISVLEYGSLHES